MHRPLKPHLQAVKRILRYLKHTPHGLLLHRTSNTKLQAYSDADWAGCPNDRRSTGAFWVFLGLNLISWSSRKQPTVSRSFTEAEYKAVANTTVELLWIHAVLLELGINLSSHQRCGVITLGPHTCRSTQFFMRVRSMWKLISSLFVTVLLIKLQTFVSFLVLIT